ncbi:hypothetical protein [Rhodoplanes azumiensis]|uniref:Uncharacterized protein n=1 Tax=Rhodoplanes azumiensis TaxID=1897628 RepID=A0ABW5AHD2_9BRAD
MPEERLFADEIARLEDEIERLAAVAESCRKFMLAARAAIAFGAVLLAGTVLGLWTADPLALLGGLTAVIGGIVVHGSNAGTLRQSQDALLAVETRRDALIDDMALRLVPEPDAGLLPPR